MPKILITSTHNLYKVVLSDRLMKWWNCLLVLSALVFFALPLISAADYDCPANQQIFRISSQSNAHAELVSGSGNYGTDICFDDYFGAFTSTANRVCGTSNPPIIKLSQTSNAHAQIPSLSNYNFGVCFEGLSCIVQTSACLGKVEIASLSANTNAHVGIPGTYTGAGSYRLCCSVSTIPPSSEANFSSLEWRNYLGRIGRSVNRETYVNRTVTLFAATQFTPNTNITFEIWEDDSGLNPTPDDFIRRLTALTASDGSVQASYLILDSDTQIGENEPSPLEFYFKTYTTSSTISSEVNRSEILDINLTSQPNQRPNATIIAPVHRGVYFKNTVVLFNQSSFDPDGDPLSYRWTITEDNYESTSPSFFYTFTSAGQKTVTLRVTDSRGAAHEVQVAILVVASPGMLAYINRPFHKQTIVNESLWVRVNASDSYAVNSVVSGTPCPTVTCLAGNCPTPTQNSPLGCTQSITIQNTPQGFNALYFDWSFNDGDTGNGFDGLDKVSIVKRFGGASASSYDKQINLQLSYTDSSRGIINLLSSTSRVFTLLGSDQCIDSGRTFVEYDPNTGQEIGRYSTMNSRQCVGLDAVNGTSDDCCPTGYACSIGANPGCRQTNLTQCSDYTNNRTCTDDPYRLSNSSANVGWNIPPLCEDYVNGTVGTVVRCSCVWNGTSETSGACLFKKEFPGTVPGGNCLPASCTYGASTPTQCIDGFASVFVTATYSPGTCSEQGITEQECKSAEGQQAILCGQPSVALGFFNYQQFILSIIAIAGIYFLMYRRRA